MKRLIAVFLAMLIIVLTFASCGKDVAQTSQEIERPKLTETAYTDISNEEFVLCAENNGLKLYFMPSTTHFMVENTNDGSVWYSNPQNASEDEYAVKLTQMQMMSTLIVEYVNISTKKTTSLNLYTAAVRSKKYSISQMEGGVLFKYDVSEIGKRVNLAVRLQNGYLTTDVWYDALEKAKENVFVSAVKVTPYFVSGTLGDSGYLFIPDGSGALVEYNTKHIASNSYSRPIYGEEPTSITRDWYLEAKDEPIRLPVFGAVRNGSAIMAIAETGAEIGTINAYACGQESSKANVFASYSVMNSVEYDLGSYSTVIYDKNEKVFPTVTTRYYFLSGDNADYSGMARQYREYLKTKHSLEYNGVSDEFYTDVFAGVIKRVATVGIPHDKFVSLTTAEELQDMVNTLNDNGVKNITVRYRNWNLDELRGNRVDEANVDSSLKFNKLRDIKSAKIYPAVLNLESYTKGGFFDALANATYSITGLPFSIKGFLKSNLRENDETTYWVAAPNLKNNVRKLIAGLNKKEFSNIALGDISSDLYSDYRDNGYMRDYSKASALSLAEDAKQSFEGIMSDSANDYMAVLSNVIYNAPVSHSNQDILGKSVPFYTMALGALSNCVAPTLNGEKADDNLLLSAAASGAYIGYSFMHEKASELLTTDLKSLTNMNFESNCSEAIDSYSKMKEIYTAASGSKIYSHKYLTDTLTVTEYEKGVKVYVNFADSEATAENVTVSGGAFAVVGGK